jgi:Domain of unknown function (DUF6602)
VAKKGTKKNAKRKPKNRLKDLYKALEDELRAQLAARRLAHRNAEAKGEASEDVWIDLLASHLPHRYQVAKGIVIDADGKESHYIDVIIYDRQYTPLVFNQDGRMCMYIPAESVYGVLEAKQDLTRANIVYAGQKAASVRKLRRTAAPIVHAGGKIDKPKEPFEIIAGIVTYKSSWKPVRGELQIRERFFGIRDVARIVRCAIWLSCSCICWRQSPAWPVPAARVPWSPNPCSSSSSC